MEDFMVIRDPKVAKLFADRTRREILHNLRRKEMSPYRLSKVLGKPVSSICHHLKVLKDAGLVEETKSVVRGNLIERFYVSKSRRFIISYTLSWGLVPGSEDIAEWSKRVVRSAASALPSFGYEVPLERMEEVVGLMERYMAIRQATVEMVVNERVSTVDVGKHALELLIDLLTRLYLRDDEEYGKVLEKLSGVIRPSLGTASETASLSVKEQTN